MAKKDVTEMTVEEKLKNLYQLQTMLSEIDKIRTLRGELPLEVQDLEDEIEGLTHRIEKYNEDVVQLHSRPRSLCAESLQGVARRACVDAHKSE